MSIKNTILDGTGQGHEAKVGPAGPNREKSLYVNLAGVTAEVSVPVFAGPIAGAEIFDEFLLNGGSEQMAVNGSVTPVAFRLDADATKDIIITSWVISGTDGSIKFTNWFAFNQVLTNGVDITFKSDDVPSETISSSFVGIDTTTRLIGLSGGNAIISAVTGEAIVTSFRDFDPALIIRKQGFHESGVDDFIQILIQDNLTGMDDFTCSVRGIKIESGLF
jgi:hypothetical protein